MFTGATKINSNDYFEGEVGQKTRESRLQIIYDQEIIETFSNLKQPEPIIYKVEPPLVKEKKNIKINLTVQMNCEVYLFHILRNPIPTCLFSSNIQRPIGITK